MADVIHIVTDPEGRQHEVTGPADAKPEEVIAAAQHLIGRTNDRERNTVIPAPGEPETPRYGRRPIEPGSTEESVHEAGKTLIPLLAGAGVGGLAGKGASMATGAAPRLLPAIGRILGTGAVGGAQTPGDMSEKVVGGAKAAGSAAVAEAALPLLVGGSRLLKGVRNLMQGERPGIENVHVKSAPPNVPPSTVGQPFYMKGQSSAGGNIPNNPNASGTIPDPADPRLNIIDVIRSKYGLNVPKGPSVPSSVQTAADAGAGTETGQNVSGIATMGLVNRLLQHAGLGMSGRVPVFQRSGLPGA